MKTRRILAICVGLFLFLACSDVGITDPVTDDPVEIEHQSGGSQND